jgi:hypothetical protein
MLKDLQLPREGSTPPGALTLTGGPASLAFPAVVAASGQRAGVRFLEFFTAQIRNPHIQAAESIKANSH